MCKSHLSGYLQAKAKSEKAAKSAKEVKKVKVSLINMKRAQNAGIALARIRYSYSELRQKIQVGVCGDCMCGVACCCDGNACMRTSIPLRWYI
jgi:hypothetical protein